MEPASPPSGIETLEPIETIRRRPGIFVGEVADGSGLLVLVEELLACALEEHSAGHCARVVVTLGDDDSVEVRDDGRGFPVERDARERGRTVLERAFQCWSVGPTSEGYAPDWRLEPRGSGLVAVSALSEWLEVEVQRGGRRYAQRYERGRPATPLRDLGPTEGRGTRVRFRADPAVFATVRPDAARLSARLRELACFFPGLRCALAFAPREFYSPRGLEALVDDLAPAEHRAHPGVVSLARDRADHAGVSLERIEGGLRVEVALRLLRVPGFGRVRCYSNTQPEPEPRAMTRGFHEALRSVRALASAERRGAARPLRDFVVAVVSAHSRDLRPFSPMRWWETGIDPDVRAVTRDALGALARRYPGALDEVIAAAAGR